MVYSQYMGEREPQREPIGRGELFTLAHPGDANTFSGYGLTLHPDRPDRLVGLLMVDRPQPVDPRWLVAVSATYGECDLYAITTGGERGLACRMQIEPDSLPHLQRFPSEKADAMQAALQPLLDQPPVPTLRLSWDAEKQAWASRLAPPNELTPEIRQVFEHSGYGCLPVESSIGVVHLCHAPDVDIEGFRGRPAGYRWELIEMPTAPLVRLSVRIYDWIEDPYRFESFLNVGAADQLQALAQLAGQEKLYLAFYGDELAYHFTKILHHDEEQWQQLDEIIIQAEAYQAQLPPEQRDFDQAKADFMRRDRQAAPKHSQP